MKRRLPRLLFALGAAFLLLVGVLLAADWGPSVVVRDAGGTVVARSTLPDSGQFEIEYVHSYYGEPAAEHFVADQDGGFRLDRVSSRSEAVLDYYELEGRKEAVDGSLRLVLEEPQRFEVLPLIGTQKGRRTLIVSGERSPLYERGRPVHLTIRVEEGTPFSVLRGTFVP